ncbi:MAG: PIN domain-containing protein [Candidatus Aenigmarchaeota archaeon]|nr:PIN domain-containing protein [Candidatus Aenigmarchaeota archaeon]
MVKYFFDTYALIEITKNKPNYIKFVEETIATSKFNLVELIYITLSDLGEESAKKIFQRFKDSEIGIPDDILFKAMIFRFRNRKKGLSYVDCIGYVFALENGLTFLTGDSAFENMENVEFVK